MSSKERKGLNDGDMQMHIFGIFCNKCIFEHNFVK
jgi:hypothetical protein